MAQLVTWPTLNENNDENVRATITTNQPTEGTVLNLTGKTVEAFLKPSAATGDGDPTVWMGSSATGEVVITSAAGGQVEIAIPAAAMTTTKGWLRVDVVEAALRKTAAYGPVTVTDL